MKTMAQDGRGWPAQERAGWMNRRGRGIIRSVALFFGWVDWSGKRPVSHAGYVPVCRYHTRLDGQMVMPGMGKPFEWRSRE